MCQDCALELLLPFLFKSLVFVFPAYQFYPISSFKLEKPLDPLHVPIPSELYNGTHHLRAIKVVTFQSLNVTQCC